MKRLFLLLGVALALFACYLLLQKSPDQEAEDLGTPQPPIAQDADDIKAERAALAAPRAETTKRTVADKSPAAEPVSQREEVDADKAQHQLGTLRGIVVLGDGTPVEKFRVHAQLITNDSGAPPMKRRVLTDKRGGFVIDGLPKGDYQFVLPSEMNWDPRQPTKFETDGDAIRLVVDALLVTFRNVLPSGEATTMESLQVSSHWEEGKPRTTCSKRTFPGSRESVDRVLSSNRKHVVRSEGSEGHFYFGLIESGTPSGHILMDLIHDHPDFGALIVHVNQPELPEGAALSLSSLELNGGTCFTQSLPAVQQQGKIRLEVGGLLPGHYALELNLESGGYVALIQDQPKLSVDAGGVHELHLDTRIGGVLKVQVHSSIEMDERSQADVEYHKLGEMEWAPLWATTYWDGNSSSSGNSAFVEGPAAVTAPIPSGHYTIRVSLKGHTPQEQNVQVVTSTTQKIEMTLYPE